eukprot:GHVU01197698.1.p1 GENE.GHVU01197698.1~~GHVU01197698.1.p1  ORF type:complete len:143 (-),score=9.37 GHVU01197698.1:158-586(-)
MSLCACGCMYACVWVHVRVCMWPCACVCMRVTPGLLRSYPNLPPTEFRGDLENGSPKLGVLREANTGDIVSQGEFSGALLQGLGVKWFSPPFPAATPPQENGQSLQQAGQYQSDSVNGFGVSWLETGDVAFAGSYSNGLPNF